MMDEDVNSESDGLASRRQFLTSIGATAGLVAVASGTVAAGSQEASEWPQFGYDPGRTGHRPTQSLEQRPGIDWKADFPGVHTAPLVVNGTVLVGKHRPKSAGGKALVGLDAESGDEKWRYELKGNVVGTPACAGGVAYFTTGRYGKVHAVDVESGRALWYRETAPTPTGPVSVADGLVYISGGGNWHVFAFDADTGDEVWRYQTNDGIKLAPALTQRRVIVASGDGSIYAVSRSGGVRLWSESVGASTVPTIADGRVIVGTGSGITALSVDDGTRQWTFETRGEVRSPSVGGDTVYVPSTDDNLYAVDAETGAERWRFLAGGPLAPKPTVTADSVLAASRNQTGLFTLKASNGDVRWQLGAGKMSFPVAVTESSAYLVAGSSLVRLATDNAGTATSSGADSNPTVQSRPSTGVGEETASTTPTATSSSTAARGASSQEVTQTGPTPGGAGGIDTGWLVGGVTGSVLLGLGGYQLLKRSGGHDIDIKADGPVEVLVDQASKSETTTDVTDTDKTNVEDAVMKGSNVGTSDEPPTDDPENRRETYCIHCRNPIPERRTSCPSCGRDVE
jgi:outer membrane protein assembly factor BamB